MPNRIVREGCLDSERLDALSEQAENFYKRLLNVVDDYGRFEADVVVLLARTYPRRVTRYTPEMIERWLSECSSGTEPLVIVYQSGRKRYLQITDFRQRVRSESKFPAPDGPMSAAGLPAARLACATNTTTHTHTHSTTTTKEEGLGETIEADPTEIIHRTLAEIVPNHPKSSPMPWAIAAVEREIASHRLDAREFCEALKKTHVEHCKIYERELAENPRAFVPLFHKWVSDEYYLHRPSNRDPPVKKPSYAQAVAAGLVTNLEEYERRFHA